MRRLEQKVADFISAEGLFKPGEKVLLACSGGADSTALLYIIAAIKLNGRFPCAASLRGVKICCAHINHQLRGVEAGRDEEFVVKQCRKLGLKVVTRKINVREYAEKHKLSTETAARKLRIEALLDIAGQQNCACIATAHHKNDNAETVLQRLSRGTGLRGLCGIWPVKQFSENFRFIRPLLCASRWEILKYLNGRKIKWCEDHTNIDCAYRRNFIRNRLLPNLQRNCKTDLVGQISELSRSARGLYRCVSSTADVAWPRAAAVERESISLDLDVIRKLHPEVKIELVRRALSHLAAGEPREINNPQTQSKSQAVISRGEQDFTENHYRGILKLSKGAKLQLPGDLIAHRQGSVIIFGRRQTQEKTPSLLLGVNLEMPGKTEFAGVLIEAEMFDYDSAKFEKFKANKSNTVEWLDFDRVKLPLKVRLRKIGDKFWPLGLAGEKKIGKFLTTAKVSAELRQKLLIIADAEKIIWLCPVRLSEQAKITRQTKKVVQLKIY